VHFIDSWTPGCQRLAGAAALLTMLSGCSSQLPAWRAPEAAQPAPSATAPNSPSTNSTATRTPAPAPATVPPRTALPAPSHSRNWDDYRAQAARRMVAANPGGTYMGVPPEPLLAIPVLEVEVNADGSVRNIAVLRRPSQATDTVQLAIDAVRRAAPFGDVSRLPKPWKFSEVFLFNDERRFKPRTLDN
jgi:outer membrane biosynthesis protein TonB